MPSIIPAMTLLLGLLPVAADPLAQSAPSHAPVVTRPVAADFPSETFTLFWRPPTLNTAAPVTAYRIYREQNADSRDHIRHPADCDNNPFARSLETYAFTVSPCGTAQPGDTHGNCYRWKIAAANQNGAGPTATTQPILARGSS